MLRTAALSVVVLAWCAAAAQADTITVTTTGDPGPVGTTSLRQAITTAPAGSTIIVPAGTYVLNAGEIPIDRGLTITGAGAPTTTVSGNETGRVFRLDSSGAVTITDLTVTKGRVVTPSGAVEGGAILADDASPLTLQRVRLVGNGIDVSGTTNPGGIAKGGAIATASPVTLVDSAVLQTSVRAVGGTGRPGGIIDGGALYSGGTPSATMTLTGVVVDGTTADTAGAPGQPGGIVDGGGIYTDEAPVILQRVAVTNGLASARGFGSGGGGIVNGAGIFAGGALTATNTTIANNTADAGAEAGGGVADGGGVVPLTGMTLTNVTLSGNRALAAGASEGIAGGGNYESGDGPDVAVNTIIAGGVAKAGSENCDVALTSHGHNIDSLDQCGFHAAGDHASTAPLLGALADNGGATLTLALLAGSPAIDAGDAASCPALDQRSVARPQGPACDIGAFELEQQPPAPPDDGSKQSPATTTTETTPAPAAPALTAVSAPAKLPKFSDVVILPAAKSCVSRRNFRIRLRIPKGVAVRRAIVKVNGRRVAVREGKRLTAPVDLRKLPKGRFTVAITVQLKDGRQIQGQRKYRTCARKRKGGRPKV